MFESNAYVELSSSCSFIVLNHELGDFYEDIPKAIASGELIKPVEHITKGLDNVSSAFLTFRLFLIVRC